MEYLTKDEIEFDHEDDCGYPMCSCAEKAWKEVEAQQEMAKEAYYDEARHGL